MNDNYCKDNRSCQCYSLVEMCCSIFLCRC